MKVLVTGSRGFIGSNLCKTLVNEGVIPFGVDREIRPEGSSIYGLFHQASFEDDSVAQMVIDLDIDTICHLAADADVPDSLRDPGKYYQNNVVATIQLLNNLVKRKWKGKFIFSSSAAVYPSMEKLVDESVTPDPLNPYGRSKLIGEQVLKDYYLAHGINVVCFRYFNVAGAWDDTGDHFYSDHVIQKLIKSHYNDSKFVVYGSDLDTPDGTCVRDYLHVRDVCNAHITAIGYLDNSPGFHVFNLGTSVGTSVKELLSSFMINTGKGINFTTGDYRLGDPLYLVANGNKFINETGFSYKHSDLNNIVTSAFEYSKGKYKVGYGI